jgi:hypothetical protein
MRLLKMMRKVVFIFEQPGGEKSHQPDLELFDAGKHFLSGKRRLDRERLKSMNNVIESEDLFNSSKDEGDHQATNSFLMETKLYAHNNPENSADDIFIGIGICLLAFFQLTFIEYGIPTLMCLMAPLAGIAFGLRMFLRGETLSTDIFPELKNYVAAKESAKVIPINAYKRA